ncbi:MAG TPA: hypothetical protein VFC63_00485 [Blastocatellia bacterium]|nr:hypothetical protein [Blastocatellia bacterium]
MSSDCKVTYKYCPDLWVIVSYFNPLNYRTRRFNYEVFVGALERSGLNYLTVECAFEGQQFSLPNSSRVIKVRSNSVLWQKERLLNLAVSWLPRSCQYVAWIDCDLLFTNSDWTIRTVSLLNDFPVVQLFERCIRLPQDHLWYQGEGNICQSFASITSRDQTTLHSGRFDDHGHTGYAWAARRDILDSCGLYEYAIAGSGDHYMAHAIFGDFAGICIRRMMFDNPSLLLHFRDWATKFYKETDNRIAAVSGDVLHLWHGDIENRQYLLRHRELAEYNFNPFTDIKALPGRPLEWNTNNEALKNWFSNYFESRREDGQSIPEKEIAA